MSTYAIGDIHGCSRTLQSLIGTLPFDPGADRLWLVGDLVGHGPDSVGALRLVSTLEARLGIAPTVVLGNHDLRLLAARAGVAASREARRLCREVLAAPDGSALLDWLSALPLLHAEEELILVHAGLLPQWTADAALGRATDAQAMLGSERSTELLAAIFSTRGRSGATAPDLAPTIETLQVMTTVRTIDAEGRLRDYKGPPEGAPPGCIPWFALEQPAQREATVVFGHWASLGLRMGEGWVAVDSGCAWDGPLSAVRLEDRQVFQVPRID